jgi:hypothetical protein
MPIATSKVFLGSKKSVKLLFFSIFSIVALVSSKSFESFVKEENYDLKVFCKLTCLLIVMKNRSFRGMFLVKLKLE